jgi:hypothetical protein
MSSLWTPGGEHKVPQTEDAAPASRPESTAPPDFGEEELDEATAAELQELTRQLASAPPEDVIANHCYGFFELAALHLSRQPPNLEAARLPIDAMALLVDGLGERLGQHRATLADGLNQLRMAYVRIADAATAAVTDAAGANSPPPSDTPDTAEAPSASDRPDTTETPDTGETPDAGETPNAGETLETTEPPDSAGAADDA